MPTLIGRASPSDYFGTGESVQRTSTGTDVDQTRVLKFSRSEPAAGGSVLTSAYLFHTSRDTTRCGRSEVRVEMAAACAILELLHCVVHRRLIDLLVGRGTEKVGVACGAVRSER